jgi:hypothetical protein
VFGKPKNNTISLEDEFSDLAIIDTIFPGVYIPSRVWKNFKSIFMSNVTGLNCSYT